MKTYRQDGSTMFVVMFIASTVLLVLSLGFGIWAFVGRQDYKNNSDVKSAAAVEAAKADQKTLLEKQFAEREKSPNKTYTSSPTYGSVTFNYPKTWSVYIEESDSSKPLSGYFAPNYVPAVNQDGAKYALRLELSSESYDQVLQAYSSQLESGDLKAKAFVPPPLNGQPNVQTGVRLDGQLEPDQEGSMVILKVRDKTLKITTDTKNYLTDFNSTVLDSLSFSP